MFALVQIAPRLSYSGSRSAERNPNRLGSRQRTGFRSRLRSPSASLESVNALLAAAFWDFSSVSWIGSSLLRRNARHFRVDVLPRPRSSVATAASGKKYLQPDRQKRFFESELALVSFHGGGPDLRVTVKS